MFKFVEKKWFFYVCAILSCLYQIFPIMAIQKKSIDLYFAFYVIFILCILFTMMMFFDYKHKELMKVLLTTFIVTTIFIFVPSFSTLTSRLHLILTRTFGSVDPIRRVISYGSVIAIFLIVIVIFINHCIMNFTGVSSKVAININKVLTILLVIFVITEKTSLIIVRQVYLSEKLGSSYIISQIVTNIDIMLYVLTAVSAEAFINSQRNERTAKTTTIQTNKKSKKK